MYEQQIIISDNLENDVHRAWRAEAEALKREP